MLLALLVLAPSVVVDVAGVDDEIDVASRLSILVVVVAFIARESDVTEDVAPFCRCCCNILEVWPLAIIVVAALWK